MGCHMTRMCGKRAQAQGEENEGGVDQVEDKSLSKDGQHFSPKKGLQLSTGGTEDRKIGRWRPAGLEVPGGESPTNKGNSSKSPLHTATNVGELRAMILASKKGKKLGRTALQSPNIIKAFSGFDTPMNGEMPKNAFNDSSNNPLTEPIDEDDELEALGANAGAELMAMMQAASLGKKLNREQMGELYRHAVQSPAAVAQFGDYGDPAKTPTGYKPDGTNSTPTPSRRKGSATPNGFPLKANPSFFPETEEVPEGEEGKEEEKGNQQVEEEKGDNVEEVPQQES